MLPIVKDNVTFKYFTVEINNFEVTTKIGASQRSSALTSPSIPTT